MKKISFWVTMGMLLITFLILSFCNYSPTSNFRDLYNLLGLIYFLILIICGLYTSIVIINSITKSPLSLINKTVYSFMINFSIFGLILLMWIFGGNTINDDKGLATTIIIIPSVIIFTAIGFIISLILSIKRGDLNVFNDTFKYRYFSIISFVLVLFALLFVYRAEIYMKIAITLNNEKFCPSSQSPIHSNCVDRIIKTKAINSKDVEMCLKSSVAGYCVMEIAWSTGNKNFCEYLEGGSMFRNEFYMERLDKGFCLSRR
jgi:hypothetical protein